MSANETKEPEEFEAKEPQQQGDPSSENETQAAAAEPAAEPSAENAAENAAETEAENAAEQAEEDPRIAELQRQVEENHNRFLRAQADFENYRRRTLREKEELSQYATSKLISQLLPVIDNFQRALQAGGEGTDAGAFVKGVDMIYRQLVQVLEGEGLKAMDPVGQPFDPELHQAIMRVESEEHEEGIVVEVVQPGYWLKDKVLRPALVKVSG